MAYAFNKMNLPIILTHHINSNEDAKLMAQWWDDLITEKDDLSEITPELNLHNSMIIKKTQYDGFYHKSLEDILIKEESVNL